MSGDKLLEMEGVTLVRYGPGPDGHTEYWMNTDDACNDGGIGITLAQLEALARELPFIVEQEKGGDSTDGQD